MQLSIIEYNLFQGAIDCGFECTIDFNEYLVSGDYVSDFNDFKSSWHHKTAYSSV